LAAILSFLSGRTFLLPLASQFCVIFIFSPFFFVIFCLNCLISLSLAENFLFLFSDAKVHPLLGCGVIQFFPFMVLFEFHHRKEEMYQKSEV